MQAQAHGKLVSEESTAASGAVLLTVEEAARRLAVSRALAYQLIAAGRLPSVRIGRLRRVPVAALEAFARELMEDAAS